MENLIPNMCETLVNALMWLIENKTIMLIIFGSLFGLTIIIKIVVRTKNNESIKVPSFEENNKIEYNYFDNCISEDKCFICDYCGAKIKNLDSNKCPCCGANFEL